MECHTDELADTGLIVALRGLKHLMMDAYSTPHVCIPTPNSLSLESWESVGQDGLGTCSCSTDSRTRARCGHLKRSVITHKVRRRVECMSLASVSVRHESLVTARGYPFIRRPSLLGADTNPKVFENTFSGHLFGNTGSRDPVVQRSQEDMGRKTHTRISSLTDST